MTSDVLGKLLRMLRVLQERIARRSSRERKRPASSKSRHRRCSRAFRMLRRGEITLAAYLDEKIQQALVPLEELLHESDVRFVRSVLLERLRVDPVLSSLVERFARLSSSRKSV